MTAVTVTALASCKDKTVDPETPVTPTPTVETYTATFKQDGTTLKVYTLEKGAQIVYSAVTPSKTPDERYTYSFKGWDYTNDGVVDNLPTISADIVFEAIFDRTEKVVASHTVKVIDRGNVVYTGSVKEGENVTITGVSTPENYEDDNYTYTFDGWLYNNTLITSLSGYKMGTSDMTFTAHYNRVEKTQGGEQGGGQGGEQVEEKIYVSFYDGSNLITQIATTKDASVNLSNPTKKGYNFVAWTDASGNVVDLSTKTFASDTALYASWEAKPVQTQSRFVDLVKNTFTEYSRSFTRESQIYDAENGVGTNYYMEETYIPNSYYERTVYTGYKEDKSSDKIVEHVILDGATSTATLDGQTMSYAGVYADFNEAFSKFFTDDLSEGTSFIGDYSYKFNYVFWNGPLDFYKIVRNEENEYPERFEYYNDDDYISYSNVVNGTGKKYTYDYYENELTFESSYSSPFDTEHTYKYKVVTKYTN